MCPTNELLFLYNAGSGIFDYVTNFAQKLLKKKLHDLKLEGKENGEIFKAEYTP